MRILLLLLFTFNTYGETLMDCRLQGEVLGDGKVPNDISQSCLDLVKENANDRAKYESANISVYGHANIIYYVRQNGKKGKISGASSLLHDVHALTVDEIHNTVIVIANSPKEIFTYTLKYNGNISPWYKIQNSNLKNASTINVLAGNEIEIVLDSEERSIVFDREDSNRGKEKNSKVRAKREIAHIIE